MAVSVLIKDKRLIRKKLKIEDFILDDMGYGIIDNNFRLDEGKLGNNIVVFDKKDIVRGFEISLTSEGLSIYMSLPTSENEIKRFYDYIRKVCAIFHSKNFIRENEESNFSSCDDYIAMDIEASKNAIKDIDDNLRSKKYKSMYIFGVYNPIALGKSEIDYIDCDIKKFGKLLNKLQSIDAYYATPQIFMKDGSDYLGVFTLIPNTLTIYPFEPTIFMNEDIKVSRWEIIIASEDKVSGSIDYQDFLKIIDKNILYDSEHFMVKADDKVISNLAEYFIKK